jgi:Na+/H+ antiporter NhaD/arsenite permease-like protein
MPDRPLLLTIALAALIFAPQSALAATALDGAAMSWPWALPFLGILLTIATGPLLFPKIWHRHYGKIAALWSALALAPIAILSGAGAALDALVHAILGEYLSFIVLLFALYTVAGGILVAGDVRGTPGNNAVLLAIGTLMASFVGTTGAAMILIRPLLRANLGRAHNVHVVVFFIVLVANIGGALSPLGDPPLFVGFLHGVDFFWTARELWFETALVAVLVLAAFVALDWWLYRGDRALEQSTRATPPAPIRIRGAINLVLMAAILALILVTAAWDPQVGFIIRGTKLQLQNLVRDAALVLIALASLALTPDEHREANGFSWEPIREVAKLFAGIFVCIIPVLAMLAAGRNGAFAFLLRVVTDPAGTPNEAAYFWMTGVLSAFLDNAPTYLVFFELAGGDPQTLMGSLAGTLAAISMGAVYMGALTYIGNAPNFMIYAIATERGVKMPSFFGYMAWACAVLLPVFVILTFVSLR